MHIAKARVKNFRLLSDVEIQFETSTTVVVGRNNSGKTSLTEIFRRMLGPSKEPFRIEDFSLVAHENFVRAYELFKSGAPEPEVRAEVPVLSLVVSVAYSADDADLGLLGEFVVDLDPACVTAQIELAFRLGNGKLAEFFPESLEEGSDIERRAQLFRILRERVKSDYSVYAEAVDPNDATNRKYVDIALVRRCLRADFINAQRTLDDSKLRDSNALGKIVESLFSAASGSTKEADKATAEALRAAVAKIEDEMREGFSSQLDGLLPTFNIFGYPGLPDPSLSTETALDVESLLQNHTRVRYSGLNGISLPEGHNGLGARNLIYILLKLLEYFREYEGASSVPGAHLIFLEEPEAHLHPQMQEVFIGQLDEIARQFSTLYAGGRAWPVQFVVTSHSSHMANKAPFRAMRYFLASPVSGMAGICTSKIKDLRKGFASIPPADEEFLHQYMTLTRCDLLFADKAVLAEGLSERLLMPIMIQKVDSMAEEASPKLGTQYVSLIEVGGAYAHLFFDLLRFLELKTLVVTDLDSVKGMHGNKCVVSVGEKTSNACIKHWFHPNELTPANLLAVEDADKTDGLIRVAYQLPESAGSACGRSLEESFMLANSSMFGIGGTLTEAELAASEKAAAVKKSDFALKHALTDTGWVTPRYIAEGLTWLAGNPSCDADVQDADEPGGAQHA